ncbi:hypothetical protein PF010_g10428 [Phytophthora fragariae]|uniref:Uncharacterized protein n=2 Tax=Phytophthora TaxID=4783 RepID=A0A6A3F6I7_9STRA|nr:hypothetical protein PF003_g34468 [Phytophthora fragariae]KAE9040733.1 hypothetical protein PR002_g4805 [Phytophthora rubi]KAE8937718.1 hypothetical protein PF009_g12382 [Phytophthora fragariae]KAE9112463.1 hypothetical protein PF010_g10428 [Phytophthora fragariae]KAE9231381.1 hypothetical protein PF004_g10226 [Phytophthora fragariae]
MVPSKLDLYPEELRSEIDEVNDWIYNDVGHGVYKCGFAGMQELYDATVANPTLVRFDEVYAVANKKLIEQYPNLSDSTSGSSIYQLPRMAETVNLQHVKIHYYGSHTHMNPFGIIPTGPNIDFTRPHDRDRFTNAILPAFE